MAQLLKGAGVQGYEMQEQSAVDAPFQNFNLGNGKEKDERAMSQHKRISTPGTVWHAAAFKRSGHLVMAAARELRTLKGNKQIPLLESEIRQAEMGEIKKYIISRRGLEYNETLLHVACLYSNIEVADFLIKNCPTLINEVYSDIYTGETALHIAIVRADVDLVKILLGYPFLDPSPPIFPPDSDNPNGERVVANVNARVRGDFFDLKKGHVYFGDHPLAFAVCLQNDCKKEIIRLLIEKGARLDVRDNYGNNLLHICVHNNDLDMYHYVSNMFDLYKRHLLRDVNDLIHDLNLKTEEEEKEKNVKQASPKIKLIDIEEYDLESITNYADRTPLTLAVEMGKMDMVKLILNRRKKILWTYGPVAAAAYPLREVDSFHEKRSDPVKALMLLVYSKSEKGNPRKHLLEQTPFKEILDHKWRQFGFYGYIFFLFWHIIYLGAIAFAVVQPEPLLVNGEPGVFIDFCEVFVIFCAGAIWCREVTDIITMGKAYFDEEGTRPFRVINWVSAALFYAAVPLRFTGYQFEEQMMVSVAGCLAYIYVLYYARGEIHLGSYVVVLRKMILGDFAQFLGIYFCLLFGFGLIFWTTFRDSGQQVLQSYPWTLLTLYRMSIFDFTGYNPEDSEQSSLTIASFVIYTSLTGIVMMNMLIAMMNETYENIRSEAFFQWKLEWASIVLWIERRLPNSLMLKYDNLRVGKPGHALGLADDHYYLMVYEKGDWALFEEKKNLRKILRSAIHRVWVQVWNRKAEKTMKELAQKKKKQKAKENLQKAFSQVRERLYIVSVLKHNKASTEVGDVAARELVDKYMEKYGKVDFEESAIQSKTDDDDGPKTAAQEQEERDLTDMVNGFLQKQLIDEKKE